MEGEGNDAHLVLIKQALLKSPQHRSYDEILMLNSHIAKTDFIKNTLSTGLFPKQMDELCRHLVLESFKEGDRIIRQNDVGDRMYIVLRGVCEVRMRQVVELAHGESEMREKALFKCTSNMHFGEKALMNDEPRAASIVALEQTDLISISKFVYNSLIKAAHAEAESAGAKMDQPGTKAHLLKVLSKKTEFRTKLEIEGVANYLDWRIPFFREFTPEQQLELCRVSQSVSIWGENVLFKQGSVGQAFYVILTGSVEVWVASAEEMALNTLAQKQALNGGHHHKTETLSATNALKQGLGNKVAMLAVGDTFGERALENDDSMRMASIVTGEGNTDLLVIAREDYHKLVSALYNKELMKRITLLRKTDIFRNMDATYLKELSRYMEPKRYEIDEVLFNAGEKATEMIIIDIGECGVDVPIATFNTATTITATRTRTESMDGILLDNNVEDKTRKQKMQTIGRVAPKSVLAPYVTQIKSMYDPVIHPETVWACTLVVAYAVDLHDFVSHMNKECKKMVVKEVKDHVSAKVLSLWDNAPPRFGDAQWRRQNAWNKYKASVTKKGSMTYLESLKSFSNLYLTPDSGNHYQDKHGLYKPKTTDLPAFFPMQSYIESSVFSDDDYDINASESVDSSTMFGKASQSRVDINWGLPNTTKKQIKDIREEVSHDIFTSHPVVEKALFAAEERERERILIEALEDASGVKKSFSSGSYASTKSNSSTGSMIRNLKENIGGETTTRYAFSLVHLHQSNVAQSAQSLGAQRRLQSYMRMCGTLKSCSDAKDAAATQMQSVLLMLFKGDMSKKHQLDLRWRSFSSFEGMPLHNSDIFMVYCRSVLVEYACITPELNMMDFDFPSLCKQRNQFFACTVMMNIKIPDAPLPSMELTIKKRRAKRKPLKANEYGIEYDDTDDDDDDNDSTDIRVAREHNIQAAGLPATSQYKTDKFNLQLTETIFKQELGAFVETLATGTTQKTCLLYGKIVQAKIDAVDPIELMYTKEREKRNDREAKEKARSTTASVVSLNASQSMPNLERGKPPKTPWGAGSSSRSVDNLNPNRRVCVFPLYEWLPITEETFNEFDISAVDTSFSPSSSPKKPTNAVKAISITDGFGLEKIDLKYGRDSAKTSFAEAGMTGIQTKRSNVKVLKELPCLGAVAKDVVIKSLGDCIDTKLHEEEEDEKIRIETERLEKKLRKKQKKKEVVTLTEEKAVANQDDPTLGFIETAEKAEALKQILSERNRMITLNDKLCYDEFKLKSITSGKRSNKIKDKDKKISGDPVHQAEEEVLSDDSGDGFSFAPPRSLSVNQLADVSSERAPPEDPNRFKRGVNLQRSASNGTVGPGGMGMLVQRMRMYDALSTLPPNRNAAEKGIKAEYAKKRTAEERAAMIAKAKKEASEQEVKVYNPAAESTAYNPRTTILPSSLGALKRVMDATLPPDAY